MNIGLFLIPALAGYWFLTHAYVTRYDVQRYSGYQLFFACAIAGAALLAVARLLVVLLDGLVPVAIQVFWKTYAPFDYSGTLVFGGLLAGALPPVVNLFTTKHVRATKAARASGNLIECLIQDALDSSTLIELSTKNGKSYVGFARESGVAITGEADVALIPLMSGYRHDDTRELEITTHYANVLGQCLDDPNRFPDLSLEDFQVVLPIDEVASARLFHTGAYKLFRSDAVTRAATKTKSRHGGRTWIGAGAPDAGGACSV